MANFDDLKLATEALSGGKNTVILDDIGMPSIMVRLPKQLSSDLDASFSQTTHPAFVLNGNDKAAVYMSKFQNIVLNDRAYSLPLKDPKTYITYDQAVAACRKKGDDWGLNPAALWSAVALWSKKNGTMPRGNNNYGKDHSYTHERGVETSKDGTNTGRTATGSGPDTWNHNWLPDGIADMNGNVWEWCAGLRIVNGEIQIIPYANCMFPGTDMSANSADWKAITEDGSFVAPGTSGSLKLDVVSGQVKVVTSLTPADKGQGGSFEGMGTTLSKVPQILKELTLYPNGTGYEGDYFYLNTSGERLLLRGGIWGSAGDAGVFSSHLHFPRSSSYSHVGFRSAFYGTL